MGCEVLLVHKCKCILWCLISSIICIPHLFNCLLWCPKSSLIKSCFCFNFSGMEPSPWLSPPSESSSGIVGNIYCNASSVGTGISLITKMKQLTSCWLRGASCHPWSLVYIVGFPSLITAKHVCNLEIWDS